MSGFDLSRRARGDVVDIGVYGAERWGDERSERYVSEFYTVFQWLVEGRSIGRRCERVRPGLWRIEHASHVVSFPVCTRLTTTNNVLPTGHFPLPKDVGYHFKAGQE